MSAETPRSASPASADARVESRDGRAAQRRSRSPRAHALLRLLRSHRLLRRDRRRRRPVPPRAAALRAPARRAGAARDGAPAAPRRRRLPPGRHHVLGVLRQPRRREDLPVRPHPARRHRARVDARSSAASSSASRRSTSSWPTSTAPQKILREKPVLRDLVQSSTGHLPRVDGIKPPLGVYVHVAGIDLVRGPTARSSCSRTTCGCPRASPT